MKRGPAVMRGWIGRRQIFVHPIQYRFLAADLLYLLLILVSLAIPVFGPLMHALDDPSLSYQEKGIVAERFLGLHEWFWLWALGAFLLLIVHSVHSIVMVHRIAGPLYRLQKVFGAVGSGQLSVRTTLREHDYLHWEAESLNHMLTQFETMVRDLESRCTRVCSGYDRLETKLAINADPELAETLRGLESELTQLKACLEAFTTRTQ